MTIAFPNFPDRAYRGSKLIVFVGDKLVSVLRDDIATIPWPDTGISPVVAARATRRR